MIKDRTTLLSTGDPRTLSSSQWKSYNKLITDWLKSHGMIEGCSVCSGSGIQYFDGFGTEFFLPGQDFKFMLNYITSPLVARSILEEWEFPTFQLSITTLKKLFEN
jgi:hypothetical protein